jgi:hypothetical protein
VKDEKTSAPEHVEGPVQPANLAVGSVAATEVETTYPKAEQTEKTVHSLFTPVTEVPEPVEGPTDNSNDSKVVEPVKGPSKEGPTPIEDQQPIDDEPLFDPVDEPTPAAPAYDTPQSPRYDDERPVVRIFENPFRSGGGDEEGFEITSRIMTKEETQARAEQEIAVLEAKKAKETDPKEQLKKQRLRALSVNFRTARGLEELESQPAYLRRNVEISHDEEGLSEYSASQNGISGENSFLHKNVD